MGQKHKQRRVKVFVWSSALRIVKWPEISLYVSLFCLRDLYDFYTVTDKKRMKAQAIFHNLCT